MAGAAQAVAKSDRDSRVGQKWDRSTKTFPRVIEIALCGSSIDASLWSDFICYLFFCPFLLRVTFQIKKFVSRSFCAPILNGMRWADDASPSVRPSCHFPEWRGSNSIKINKKSKPINIERKCAILQPAINRRIGPTTACNLLKNMSTLPPAVVHLFRLIIY